MGGDGSSQASPHDLSVDRVKALVRDVTGLVARRAEAEAEVERRHRADAEAARACRDRERSRLDQEREEAVRDAGAAFVETKRALDARFAREDRRTRRAQQSDRQTIDDKAQHSEKAARTKLEEAVWAAETVYEAKEGAPDKALAARRKELAARLGQLESARRDAVGHLARSRVRPPAAVPAPGGAPGSLDERLAEARAHLARLHGLPLLRLVRGPVPFVLAVLPAAALVAAAGLVRGWQPDEVLVGAGAAGLVLGAGATIWLYTAARSRARAVFGALETAVQLGRLAHEDALALAEQQRDRELGDLVRTRDTEVREAKATWEPILAQIAERRRAHVERIEQEYPRILEDVRARHERDTEANRAQRERVLGEANTRHASAAEALEASHGEQAAQVERTRAEAWSELVRAWTGGMAAARAEAEAIAAVGGALFPAWSDPAWDRWTPGDGFAPAVRFGGIHLDAAALPGGLSDDPRLAVDGPTRFDLPAVLSFPDHCSMLLESTGTGGAEAVGALRTAMMRLLTTIPPGKVRFTIIDPIGLGRNFAGFMHLADYNEAFVGGKIWTETRHIEQQLADLTEHMENVIQKYLRNEYETIAQYNLDAGEIAEPYRFVVICDYPTNFSDSAARRLASILASGARCGVYALISRDSRLDMPAAALEDLRARTVNLAWEQDRFVWKDPDLAHLPLRIDAPPPESFVTDRLKVIGEAALDATRVEVPFEVVAPPPGERWTREASSMLRVPLGRAGATRLQHFTLGKGTNQHALVAGRTGSGKSTLLHVLITNLALWYGPDEVELYLVDFKKGVEFKTYAAHRLPHARAVAIESDREFGLSVLERLDQELKRRGELFRAAGAQDLAAYRRAGDAGRLPRTLLVIDEFQEFFVEDDKIAQDAALLLDRLVRQGRAFGLHVLLGSQTLGGAYALARSTLEQMGVRVALQCSETDSYLILSDDNAAARLLSRPGEAIYNDANGRVEGNSPFQVVWLDERVRERCLDEVRGLAAEHGFEPREPAIVFEGNVPADIAANAELSRRLSGDGAAASGAPRAWLGEPVAIKCPSAAVLGRQAGSNLVVVGQRDEQALAMTAAALVGLAAQHRRDGARFWIFDGTAADSPNAGYVQRVAAGLPQPVRVVAWRDVEAALGELAGELSRRTGATEPAADPAVYVVVHGLQRFRMLRRSDDAFGFSLDDGAKAPAADKQFAELLREGPAVGMHALVWCDTAANLERALERGGLRDFDNRVLFQMSAADSTSLIDTAAASKLGLHRALLWSEERGTLEKFRPYALPDDEWLDDAARRLEGKEAGPLPEIQGAAVVGRRADVSSRRERP